MKNPVRKVVVAYKNRRARKGNVSLWGNLDLKSIAREVEADTFQAPAEVRTGSDLSDATVNKAVVRTPNVILPTVQTPKASGGVQGALEVGALKPERAIMGSNLVQVRKVIEEIPVGQKLRTMRRGSTNGVLRRTRTLIGPIGSTDIHAEISSLEQENVRLKLELIARLQAENQNLYVMIERAEQRSILKKK